MVQGILRTLVQILIVVLVWKERGEQFDIILLDIPAWNPDQVGQDPKSHPQSPHSWHTAKYQTGQPHLL